MARILVVGLLGRAGSGKSTAAAFLESQFGAKRYAFAQPVKDLARKLWEFSEEQLYGTQAQKAAVDPRWGISARTAMIRLGDEARNVIDPLVWVNACLRRIAADGPRIAVIEDVRYPNEAEVIKRDPRFSGYVVKLEFADREARPELDDAPSERTVDQVPMTSIDMLVRHARSPDARDLKDRLSSVMGALALPVHG